MVRPNSFTCAFVPFVDAILPPAESPAFTASSMATMLESFMAGAAGAGAGVVDVAAVVSMRAVSAFLFPPPQATAVTQAPASTAPHSTRFRIDPPITKYECTIDYPGPTQGSGAGDCKFCTRIS